jgi:hypothetical protein
VYFKETQTPHSEWDVGPGKSANSAEAVAKGALPGQVGLFLLLLLLLSLSLQSSYAGQTRLSSYCMCQWCFSTAKKKNQLLLLSLLAIETPNNPHPFLLLLILIFILQVHFFPALCDVKQLRDEFERRGCSKL